MLNFHRVSEKPSPFHDGMIETTPQEFQRHLEWIGRRAEFIGENQVAALRPGGKQKILLTFDDGYRDALEVIAPILERLGIPASFFITPGLIDTRKLGAWDRIAYLVKKFPGKEFQFRGRDFSTKNGTRWAYLNLGKWSQAQLPDQGDEFVSDLASCLGIDPPTEEEMARELLTWDQVRLLASRGFAIGGHGFSHRVLSSLSIDEQRTEIHLSKSRLEEEGIRPRSFAFPFGTPDTFSWESREAALDAGFELIFTFAGQAPRLSRIDPTCIDRVPFKSTLAKYNVLLSLTGAHNVFQRVRSWRNP